MTLYFGCSFKHHVAVRQHQTLAYSMMRTWEKIEALITSKLKGEAVQVEERKPKKSVAKSMMEALRKTEESLK
jgi:hypothetical protein